MEAHGQREKGNGDGPDTPGFKALTVCLAVSSFRNDREVAALLEEVRSPEYPFSQVIVVDSLGTGAIPRLIAERGWDNVTYRSYDFNLGSAGNLCERLRLAARTEADYVLAVNHDGLIDPKVVATLLRSASGLDRVGALYPLRYVSARGQFDLTGQQALPLPARLVSRPPAAELVEVHWSSSNGALYSLTPTRRGVRPWAGVWHGWEDLEYGWALGRHGYRQFIVTGAVVADNYEHVERRAGGKRLFVTDKPAWLAYYQVRNLILATRRHRASWPYYGVVAGRVLLECGLTAVFRSDKARRYRFVLQGVIDGLRNKGGKGRWPLDPAPPLPAVPELDGGAG